QLPGPFQAPRVVPNHLDPGMNLWMNRSLHLPGKPLRPGKGLPGRGLGTLGGGGGRYRDVDGDGVTYRTLPGTEHPQAGYFTRGSGHDENARYSEDAEVYARNMDRLARKHETARSALPPPVVDQEPGATVGLIAYGTTHHAIV